MKQNQYLGRHRWQPNKPAIKIFKKLYECGGIKPQNSRKLFSIHTHIQICCCCCCTCCIHMYTITVLLYYFWNPFDLFSACFFVYLLKVKFVANFFFFFFFGYQVVLNFWGFPFYKFATLNTTPQTYVFSHTNIHMYTYIW